MSIKISTVIEKLQQFKEIYGDVEMSTDYHCVDCDDDHTGPDMRVVLNPEGEAELEIVRLGEE